MDFHKNANSHHNDFLSKLKQGTLYWVAGIAMLFAGIPALAVDVTLAWDPSPDASVAGYTVRYGTNSAMRYGTNSGDYSDFVLAFGGDTTATVPGLIGGATYYFAVSAFTLTGLESDPSEEIGYTVPGGGPMGNQPTMDSINSVTISEDAAQQSISLSGITAGAGGILNLPGIGVTATSSNPSLIPHPSVTYASPSTIGLLRFTPLRDASGTAAITVTVNNFRTLENSFSRTFTVTVNAVNDSPTLSPVSDRIIAISSEAQIVSLAGITSGAENEAQMLTISAKSANPGLVPNPLVQYTSGTSFGSLIFEPIPGASGIAAITVTVHDGQPQNNAISRTFNVVVGNPASIGIYLEAETGSVSLPMQTGTNPNASNTRYVSTPTANDGALSLQVSIPEAGDYHIWCRVNSPSSGTDSFFVSVDGGVEEIYGTAQNKWSSAWQWTKINSDNGLSGAPRTFTLSQGLHSLDFRGREAGTLLDAIYITNDKNFAPAEATRLSVASVSVPTRGMQITFPASLGAGYDLQASEDLVVWTSIWTSPVATANRILGFLDIAQPVSGKRFYRLQAR
jgi:hypothetical protein